MIYCYSHWLIKHITYSGVLSLRFILNGYESKLIFDITRQEYFGPFGDSHLKQAEIFWNKLLLCFWLYKDLAVALCILFCLYLESACLISLFLYTVYTHTLVLVQLGDLLKLTFPLMKRKSTETNCETLILWCMYTERLN